jgi:hypothetical protein
MVPFADILAYEQSVKDTLRPSDHVVELLKYYSDLIALSRSRSQKQPYQKTVRDGGGRRPSGGRTGRRGDGGGGGRGSRGGDIGRHMNRNRNRDARFSNSFSGRDSSWRGGGGARDERDGRRRGNSRGNYGSYNHGHGHGGSGGGHGDSEGGWVRSEKGGRRARARARKEESIARKAEAAGFTVTRLSHLESDNDVILNKIRVAMNKMSETNQKRIQLEVLSALQDVPEASDNPLATECFMSIIHMCCSNRYFVKQYAGIFAYILQQNPHMGRIWKGWTGTDRGADSRAHEFTSIPDTDSRAHEFTSIPDTVRYIDGEEDYDAFCKENKRHERFATFLLLLSELQRENMVGEDYIASLLEKLFETTMDRFGKERNTANNYVSNVLCKMWNDVLSSVNERKGVWADFLDRWREFMAGDLSPYPAFPRKSRFAMEDLLSKY